MRRGRSLRSFCSRAGFSADGSLVERLNETLADYPLSSFSAHLAGSLGTFGAAFLVYFHVLGLDLPALAVGGLVGRLVKRPRTVALDLPLAASLAHAAPRLNQLKLAPLLAPLVEQPARPREGGASPQVTAQQPLAERLEQRLAAAARWAEGPVNRYGGPYMFTHWLNGLLTVGTATACTHLGVDVVGALSYIPFLDAGGGGATALTSSTSCVAAAACTNSLTMPLRLVLLSIYGRRVFAALDAWNAARASRLRSDFRGALRAGEPGRLGRRGSVTRRGGGCG